MKCYYAHQISLYDTLQEERDIKILESLGFEVYNPNIDEVREAIKNAKETQPEGNYMEIVFKPLVEACDVLAFRANVDGKIGAGCYKEIEYAEKVGRLVIELPSSICERGLTVEQTRQRIKELGKR